MNAASLLPHLLRPAWLLGLLLLPVIWWLWRLRERVSNPWRRVVDAHLLAHLLELDGRTHRATPWLLMSALSIALFALAGPAWQREEAPLIESTSPLVVALDLSSSMLAADLPPSRNARMQIKLHQLIAQRRGGQLGLVAYAGAAFTVAPLSDDANSLSDLIDALLPSVMPVDGQRADLAIARSATLLKQAGFAHGQILLLTDRADVAAQSAARAAAATGYTTSVLGVGTLAGAPVAGSDGDGGIRMPRLDAMSLRALAAAGGGHYATMSAQTNDLAAVGVLDARGMTHGPGLHRAGETVVRWRDDGPWLVLVLLPLLLAGFRRGWLAAIVLVLVMLPTPRAEAAGNDWWSGLWHRDDQRAYRALQQGAAAQARTLAKSPQIAAAAAYRAGDYAAAAQAWSHAGSADAFYNRGNALAQLQKYPQAIQAYERALALQPGMRDAITNRAYVQQLLKKQQREQPQNREDQPQDHRGNRSGEGQQQGQQQQGQQQQGQQQQGQQQQGQQQQGQQQQGQQQQGQQQQGQQQQGQQQQARQPRGEQSRQPGQTSQKDQAGVTPGDAAQRQRQARADAATQRALQQALQQKQGQSGDRHDGKTRVPAEDEAQRERRDAIEQWLRQVPDDPGGLLRRKFALEYQRRLTPGEQ
jgi:Ca-activated chloride channel family protein